MNPHDALRKDLSPDEFHMFRDWIHKHSGIFLEDIKFDSLRISLVTRATRLDYQDYGDYFRHLSTDENEFKELMNLVTINETSFFRFPQQFDALRDSVIPEILQHKSPGDREFRVWSAGCSTGEEPYTIAMTLLESTLEPLGYKIDVHGSDVSTQALDKAQRGVYPARSLNNLSQNTIQRWFEPVSDGHRPVKRVRDLCSFHFHNLIKEPYPLAFMSNWDVIFCRNVTIYFRVESTRRVVDNFYDALNPGGYLFIGHSETLTSVSDRFEPVEVNGVFLYRKPLAKRTISFDDVVARRAAAERPQRRARTPLIAEQPADRPAQRPVRRAPVVVPAADRPVTAGASAGATVKSLVAEAHALLDAANASAALDSAVRALTLDPNNLDAHIVAAFAYADTGDLDAATKQANDALRVNPLAAPAHYILGVIGRERGDFAEAEAEFKRTIYIDRDFVLAHFALAGVYRQRGQIDQACRSYENTLRSLYVNPDGVWTAFLGGFRADLLSRTCELSLLECGKGRTRD